MADPAETCAKLHLAGDPNETRTVEELTRHYRSLALTSVFAPFVQLQREQEAVAGAAFEANLAIAGAAIRARDHG